MEDKSAFLNGNPKNPYAFIQWKGTDLCMDFHCDCGETCHFDGSFAYTVKCQYCNTIWEMPVNIFPRKADEKTYQYWRENPKLLEKHDDDNEYVNY